MWHFPRSADCHMASCGASSRPDRRPLVVAGDSGTSTGFRSAPTLAPKSPRRRYGPGPAGPTGAGGATHIRDRDVLRIRRGHLRPGLPPRSPE